MCCLRLTKALYGKPYFLNNTFNSDMFNLGRNLSIIKFRSNISNKSSNKISYHLFLMNKEYTKILNCLYTLIYS